MKKKYITTEPNISPFKDIDIYENSEVIAIGKDFEYETCLNEFKIRINKKAEVLFLEEVPCDNEMAIIYGPDYYTNHETSKKRPLLNYFRNKIEERKIKTLLYGLDEGRSLNILDLGSGDGRFLSLIRKYSSNLHNFYGIELSAKATEIASKKGFKVMSGNLEKIDIKEWNGKFDLIIMHQLIEHVRYPDKLLQKCYRWLKNGGIMSIETPEFAGLDFTLFKRRYWGGWHFPRHFFIFNRNSITKLLIENNFSVLSVKSILSPVFWIISIHNLLSEVPIAKKIKDFFKYNNVICLIPATIIEIFQNTLGIRSSNFQLIVKK